MTDNEKLVDYFAVLLQKSYLEMMLQLWLSDSPMIKEYAERCLREYAEVRKQKREVTQEEPMPEPFVKWFETRDA